MELCGLASSRRRAGSVCSITYLGTDPGVFMTPAVNVGDQSEKDSATLTRRLEHTPLSSYTAFTDQGWARPRALDRTELTLSQ